MDPKSISGQAEQYVRDYFDLHPNGKLLYHNLYHTEMVAKAARQIGQNYALADIDLMVVVVSYGKGTDGGVFLAKLGFQF
jgi:hypothetical protein